MALLLPKLGKRCQESRGTGPCLVEPQRQQTGAHARIGVGGEPVLDFHEVAVGVENGSAHRPPSVQSLVNFTLSEGVQSGRLPSPAGQKSRDGWVRASTASIHHSFGKARMACDYGRSPRSALCHLDANGAIMSSLSPE